MVTVRALALSFLFNMVSTVSSFVIVVEQKNLTTTMMMMMTMN